MDIGTNPSNPSNPLLCSFVVYISGHVGPSITCERGSVVKLNLDSSELSGKIAPEISLLTNLVEYISCRFHENIFYTVNFYQDYPKALLVLLTHAL